MNDNALPCLTPTLTLKISVTLFSVTTCTWQSSQVILINPFSTAIDKLIRFNSSCFKLPATTLFDLFFQQRSFNLNQLLTCNYRRETYTAAALMLSLSLLQFIMIILRKMNPCLSLGSEEEWVCLWLQSIKNLSCVKSCMCDSLYFSVQHGIKGKKNNLIWSWRRICWPVNAQCHIPLHPEGCYTQYHMLKHYWMF